MEGTPSDHSIDHTIRMTKIAIAPHIPQEEIRDHLEHLAVEIHSTAPHSVERAEAVNATFKMVVEGLPDNMRKEGMGWWYDWRERLVSPSQDSLPRARL